MSAIEIPGYKIVKTLGVGGQATVYLAIQQGFDREVALKVMSPALAADPTFGERFIREAKIVSKLSHASIVTVYDVGECGNFYYLAMEYMQGAELKTRITKGIKTKEALLIIAQLAKALNFAHGKGYIHRDVKSENILFDSDNLPVLTDFGIAKASNSATQMTQTGKLIGTPEYMSPEQCRGRKLDGGSDLYSLGIILFEILTRKVPFTGDDSVSVCIQHVTKPVPKLPARFSHLQWLIDSLLAKKSSERFRSGLALANAIESFLDDGQAVEIDSKALDKNASLSDGTPKNANKGLRTRTSQSNAIQDELEIPKDDFDDQSFELHDDFEINQRINVMPESSGVISKVVFFLLVVGIAFGGFQYRMYWVPQVQEYLGVDLFENAELKPNTDKGKPFKSATSDVNDNEQSEIIPSNNSNNENLNGVTKRDEESRQVSELIKKSYTLLQYQPHELSDVRQAFENLTTAESLAPENVELIKVRQQILAVALNEANRLITQEKFDVAGQWIQLVEFGDSNNDSLRALKLKIEQGKNNQATNESNRKAKIEQFDQLILDANEAIAENRLSSPEKNNAIYFARLADSIRPQSEQVRLIFTTVEQKYVTLINLSIERNEYAKARRYLKSLQSIPNVSRDQTLLSQKLNVSHKKFEELQLEKQRLAALASKRKKMAAERTKKLSNPLIQMKLQSNLQSAADLALQGNLVEPIGSNALEKYRAVLAIDSLDSNAINGIKKIEESIITNLEVALSNRLSGSARTWLAKLIIYDDKDQRLAGFAHQIEELELSQQLNNDETIIDHQNEDADINIEPNSPPSDQNETSNLGQTGNASEDIEEPISERAAESIMPGAESQESDENVPEL